MIFEEVNREAALAALDGPFINTRLCVTIRPDTQTYRFVNDTQQIDMNGLIFEPVPYAQFTPVSSGDGRVADTMTITFDGSNIVSVSPGQTVDAVLQSILAFPLRDRPVQVGLLVLDEQNTPIGLLAQFVGFVDNVPLDRNNRVEPVLEFNLASFRAFAARRTARTYSDTDHTSRFPGDRACRWIADTVFRNGKYSWNSETGTGAGTGGGSSGSYNIQSGTQRLF